MAWTDYFGGSVPSAVSTPISTGTDALPAWLQEFSRGLVAKGTDIAAQPYQAYTGTRIADFTAPQTQAFNQVQANQGAWQPTWQSGVNAATLGSGAGTPAQVSAAMNPFVSNVVDEMTRVGTRNFNENVLPGIQSQFVGAGQFGSRRNMDFANRASRDYFADLSGKTGQLMASEYDSALGRALQGGQILGGLGQMRSQLGLTDAQQLQAIGQQQQNMNQAGMDLAYQNFLQQRDYPAAQMEMLHNLIRGLPMDKSRYVTSSNPSTNIGGSGALTQVGQSAMALAQLKNILGIQ